MLNQGDNASAVSFLIVRTQLIVAKDGDFRMYESFYNLHPTPFRLTPDPYFFFESDTHKRGLAYLRFALQAEGFFAGGDAESAMAFVRSGAKRISDAMSFCSGRESRLYRQLQEEREGWELYYSVLAAMKTGLERGDPEADRLRGRAGETVEACRLRC